MAKDITKTFFKQPKEYGRRANENITRRDIYKNKLRNIYRLLDEKELMVGIIVGNHVAGYRVCKLNDALHLVATISEMYLLEITYAKNGKTVLVKLVGKAPQKKENVKEAV